ncbi:MAG: LrgB family protein [Clostridiales bacterium]|jgi:predicted murein hydrolase (TIGR00659 family)|nr:LrgB family protein [Clostridiales bacterium]
MNDWLSSPFFGIILCIAAFAVGVYIQKRFKTPLANPLLISTALVIIFLNVFDISFENFNQGGQIITMLLAPATAVLAMSIYRQFAILKKYFIPTLAGCLAGSVTSIITILLLCRAFGLDETLTSSLMPKSVTMPIAVGISEQHAGIASITVAAVVLTGIFGAVFAPVMARLFRIKNPVSVGVAIGTSSHVGGTTTAIQMGEVEGAMSSIAIGVAGLITTVIAIFL